MILTAVCGLVGPAIADGPDWSIDWETIDTGGGAAAQGDWAVEGTIGQPDAHGGVGGAGWKVAGGYWPAAGFCEVDYNRDGFLNLEDLSEFVTDFYTVPAIPGGVQPAAPTYPTVVRGYGRVCPDAGDAPSPFAVDAYRESGFRVGFSPDGSNVCPTDPFEAFPNLNHLSDFITSYYAAFIGGDC